MYLVSILVPICGVENYIERCVRSLFEQTYLNLEYIFIDDCSKDKSIDIVKQIALEYPNRLKNIKIIAHNCNRGLAAARNTAIENSSGLFICHVDPDDYLYKDAIRLLVKKQIEDNSDIVTGCALKHSHNEDIIISGPVFSNKKDWIKELLSVDQIYNHVLWRRLIKLELYKKYNIKSKEGCDQGEDWQIMPLLAYYANIISSIDEIVYFYDTTNENSYSANNIKNNVKSWMQDIGSVQYMESFFDNKEPFYSNISKIVVTKTMSFYLHLAVIYGNKVFYYHLLNILLSNYNNYIEYIGWNNPLKKLWGSCYWGRRFFHILRLYVRSIKKEHIKISI